MRSRAYYRHHRQRIINRKRNIVRGGRWYYKFEGVLSKGKIHCNCGMCSNKIYGYEIFRYEKSAYHYKYDSRKNLLSFE